MKLEEFFVPRRPRAATGLAVAVLAVPAALGGLALAGGLVGPAPDDTAARPAEAVSELAASSALERAVDDEKAAFDSIDEDDVATTIDLLTNPYLEGRDSPSFGLEYAAEWVAERFEGFGVKEVEDLESYLAFYERTISHPDPKVTELKTPLERELELGTDFTALLGAEGEAEGPAVFCGYGISVRGYDGLEDLELEGAIAILVAGEVRHRRALRGPEVTQAANLYRKLDRLRELGAVGALVVRRTVEASVPRPPQWPQTQPMGFRHTWAYWNGATVPYYGPAKIPALEISWEAAEALLDDDLDARMAEIDRKGKPQPWEGPRPHVELACGLVSRPSAFPNVVGVVPGSDPELAREYIVVGAHLDHIGADPLGRIGVGADDNASGVAALLEVAEAVALDPLPRSVLFVAFSSEEDGLLGSQAFVREPPVPVSSMVAMVNLDMIGRGSDSDVVALGVRENPGFDDLLRDARRRHRTGIRAIETEEGQELFQRSDHYSFHRAGVPAVFFFEHVPLSDNPDYHTWRDLPEFVDIEKVTNTARLAYCTVCELAELEERLPSPKTR